METLPERRLTKKQQSFCEEYIIDKNGTQAAIRAGYSKRTAKAIAHELLQKPHIATKVETLLTEVRERNKITVDELVATLAHQVRFDISEIYDDEGNLLNIHDIPQNIRLSLEEIQVDELWEGFGEDRRMIGETKKVKIANRQNAIQMLMKHLGAFEKDNEQKRNEVVIFKLPENNR